MHPATFHRHAPCNGRDSCLCLSGACALPRSDFQQLVLPAIQRRISSAILQIYFSQLSHTANENEKKKMKLKTKN
jgi:hypothetical protein